MLMKNKRILILIIGSFLFLSMISLQCLSAATVPIDNSTAGGIAQGLNDAGPDGTLILKNGTYTGPDNIGIFINDGVTIQGEGSGKGVVIDGDFVNTIFIINTTSNINVTFIDLNFINGYAHYYGGGGALFMNGTNLMVTFINCSFVNQEGYHNGGAICNYYGDLIISGCNFTNTSCSGYFGDGGGAIFNYKGFLNLTDSNFTNCRMIGHQCFGGAVYADSNAYIANCNFINCYSSYGGGAVGYFGTGYVGIDFVNTTIINCNFINNTAVTFGGAVVWSSANGSITRCNFVNNKVLYDTATWGGGGAIALGVTIIDIQYNRFLNNTAITGGTILNTSNSGYIDYINLDFNWWGSNTPTNLGENITINNWFVVDVVPVTLNGKIASFKYIMKLSNDYTSYDISRLANFEGFATTTLSNGIKTFSANLVQDITLENSLTGNAVYSFTIDNQKFTFNGSNMPGVLPDKIDIDNTNADIAPQQIATRTVLESIIFSLLIT